MLFIPTSPLPDPDKIEAILKPILCYIVDGLIILIPAMLIFFLALALHPQLMDEEHCKNRSQSAGPR